jgi:hypothetical protein
MIKQLYKLSILCDPIRRLAGVFDSVLIEVELKMGGGNDSAEVATRGTSWGHVGSASIASLHGIYSSKMTISKVWDVYLTTFAATRLYSVGRIYGN